MIVVASCTRIETLFIPRTPGIRVVHTPMGRAAAGALDRALAREQPSLIVSTGFCGGLDPELRPGEIVLADGIRCGAETVAIDRSLLEPARRGLEAAGVAVRVGLVASLEVVVSAPQHKARLRAGGAIAVEMEAGPVAALARRRGIGFLSLRAVLDPAQDALPFTSFRPPLRQLLCRPLLTLRLARRAVVAARAIGRAVPALIGACPGGGA